MFETVKKQNQKKKKKLNEIEKIYLKTDKLNHSQKEKEKGDVK